VLWRYEFKLGRWTKLPYQAEEPGKKARSNDPSTWATFEKALAAYETVGLDGIGFMFSKDDDFLGADLDHCLRNGQLLSWAEPLLTQLHTYGEISPSGSGVKFVGRGKLPGNGTRRKGFGDDGKGAIELYDQLRFFTITGNVFEDHDSILECQDAAVQLYQLAKARARPPAKAKAKSNGHPDDDDAVIAQIRISGDGTRFAELFDRGDTSRNNGDDSSADMALANILAVWCRGDGAQMERIFGRSALGRRDKWQRRSDYRQRTIDRAIKDCPTQSGHAAARPEIEDSTERHIVLRETLKAITSDLSLYLRGDVLGTVIAEEKSTATLPGGIVLRKAQGSRRFRPLSGAMASCRLTEYARFFRWREDKHGELFAVDVHPPKWLIEAILTCGHWPGVRPLATICSSPFVRPDGSLSAPGYDAATESLYVPDGEIPALPKNPDQRKAAHAVSRILEVVDDFPFATPDDATVWLTALLTAVQRPAIEGPVPGFAFIGNRAGCGKGLLADVIAITAWGHDAPTRPYPRDEEEGRKVKLSLALSGTSCVHFDNLRQGGYYGDSSLDSALTSRTVEDRLMGVQRDSGPVALRPVWFLTGNNVGPGNDAYRRWLPCNLETEFERPQERTDIRIADLRSHVHEQRGTILRDALTILAAHAIAARPSPWGPLGSFEDWDRSVRGAVWYATGADCLTTQRAAEKNSPQRCERLALLEGWSELPYGASKGHTVAEALTYVTENPVRYSMLNSAFLAMSRDGKSPTAKTIGYQIRAIQKTPIGGVRFEKADEDNNHVTVWKVTKT
jgi:hypothetical protein